MTGDMIGPMPAQQSDPGAGYSAAGMWLAIAGGLTQAVGSFYSLKSQKLQLRSQALSADYARFAANMNARLAEREAMAIEEAGQRAAAQATMAYGQQKASQRASLAASGVQLGSGSAAELQASTEYAKEVDRLTISANAIRQAEAARRQSVNYRNDASLLGVSARNLRGSARTISPALGAGTSLLGTGGQVLNQMATDRRLAAQLNNY